MTITNETGKNELTIQWFPGHMTKALRKIKEQLKIIDLIIFVLDARIPHLSFSPALKELSAGKQTILLINKSDLANANTTDEWVNFYRKQDYNCFKYNAVMGVTNALQKQLYYYKDQLLDKKRHRLFSPLRILVLGIPNVGKSSLINSVVKQKKAKTANRPGVTKGNQWLRVAEGIELLDTPGVLMPKISCRQDGLLLALCGSIRDGIVNEEVLLAETTASLINKGSSILLAQFNERYPFANNCLTGEAFIKGFAQQYGLLNNGGQINMVNASQRCISEFRKGQWGRISLERLRGEEVVNIFDLEFWDE